MVDKDKKIMIKIEKDDEYRYETFNYGPRNLNKAKLFMAEKLKEGYDVKFYVATQQRIEDMEG